jgi:hypothetical protein
MCSWLSLHMFSAFALMHSTNTAGHKFGSIALPWPVTLPARVRSRTTELIERPKNICVFETFISLKKQKATIPLANIIFRQLHFCQSHPKNFHSEFIRTACAIICTPRTGQNNLTADLNFCHLFIATVFTRDFRTDFFWHSDIDMSMLPNMTRFFVIVGGAHAMANHWCQNPSLDEYNRPLHYKLCSSITKLSDLRTPRLYTKQSNPDSCSNTCEHCHVSMLKITPRPQPFQTTLQTWSRFLRKSDVPTLKIQFVHVIMHPSSLQ